MPAAETQKRQIEQLQRDRRRVMEENNITHQARFFRWARGDGGTGGTRGMRETPRTRRGGGP